MIAIALTFIGATLAGLALWQTQRNPEHSRQAYINGITGIFAMAMAFALATLQARSIDRSHQAAMERCLEEHRALVESKVHLEAEQQRVLDELRESKAYVQASDKAREAFYHWERTIQRGLIDGLRRARKELEMLEQVITISPEDRVAKSEQVLNTIPELIELYSNIVSLHRMAAIQFTGNPASLNTERLSEASDRVLDLVRRQQSALSLDPSHQLNLQPIFDELVTINSISIDSLNSLEQEALSLIAQNQESFAQLDTIEGFHDFLAQLIEGP